MKMKKLSKNKIVALIVLTVIVFVCLIGAIVFIVTNGSKNDEASKTVTETTQSENEVSETQGEMSVSDMVLKLTPKMNLVEVTSLDADKIAHYYEVQTSDFAEACGVLGDVALADELVIMKAADADKVEALKAGAEARLESQKKSFQDYIPEQYQRLNETQIVVEGDYVMFVCSDAADSIIEEFQTMVNK